MFKVTVFLTCVNSCSIRYVKQIHSMSDGLIWFQQNNGSEFTYVVKNIVGWSAEPEL